MNFNASPYNSRARERELLMGIPHFPNGLWATTRSKEHMSRGRKKWASQIVVFRDPGMTSQLSLSSFPPLLFYFFCCCHTNRLERSKVREPGDGNVKQFLPPLLCGHSTHVRMSPLFPYILRICSCVYVLVSLPPSFLNRQTLIIHPNYAAKKNLPR